MGLITSKCFICGKNGINMQFETCSKCGRLCDSHLKDAVKKGIFFDSTMKICPKCGKEVKLSAITTLNNNIEQINSLNESMIGKLEQMNSFNESMNEKLKQMKSEADEKPMTKQVEEVKIGCIQGNCINGLGTMIYTEGEQYTGRWNAGKRDGHGTGTKIDGKKYVGQWKGDKPNGEGTMTYTDGTKKTGQWKDGKFIGE